MDEFAPFKADIVRHRESMHKSLDLALDILMLVLETPHVEKNDDIEFVPMEAIYKRVAEALGKPVPEPMKIIIFSELQKIMLSREAFVCQAWNFGHTMEHLTYPEEH